MIAYRRLLDIQEKARGAAHSWVPDLQILLFNGLERTYILQATRRGHRFISYYTNETVGATHPEARHLEQHINLQSNCFRDASTNIVP